ncbi:MAG: sortase [Anaerolineales bacterium]|jgi:LPXTG-site transpeptidase (sortase) family protein
MRLIIINNWSILLGFIISSFAFAGMVLAVFFPGSISFDLNPNPSISAMDVPIRFLGASAAVPEEDFGRIVEAAPMVSRNADASQDAPQPIGITPRKPEDTGQLVSKPAALESDNFEIAAAPQPAPGVPVRIVIPSINLDAPVIPAPVDFKTIAGKEYLQWYVPDEYAVGWHTTSAMLGEPGNTVLNGHHNAHGEVFVSLVDINEGDTIWVESDSRRYRYQVTNKMIVPEKYEQLDIRMNNAQWILPSVDERLTLITCWPYETNTHRLIIVARPMGQEQITLNLD